MTAVIKSMHNFCSTCLYRTTVYILSCSLSLLLPWGKKLPREQLLFLLGYREMKKVSNLNGWKKIYCVNILLRSILPFAPKGKNHNFLSHNSQLIWPGPGLVTASSCPMNRLKTALAGLHLSEPLLLELCISACINILQRNIWVYKKGSSTSG